MTDIADRVVTKNQLCSANEFQISPPAFCCLFIYLFSPLQLCAAYLTGGSSIFIEELKR